MTRDASKRTLREFVLGHCRAETLRDEQDLFSDGRVNSLFALELVLFVEKTFGLTVTDDDLDFDNFRTIDAMAAFIERKADHADRRPRSHAGPA